MRISRTPLRISLVGGGTDMPDFYMKYGGAVVSFTINKYIYVSVNERFDSSFRVSYSVTEDVPTIDLIKHELVRESLKMFWEKDGGLEITSIADIPGKGSGLGSSSAFTVGLLNALPNALYHRIAVPQRTLAETAFTIERYMCAKPVGKQDHYASAYGGFNLFEFYERTTKVSRIPFGSKEKFLLLYTGVTRSSKPILSRQEKNLVESENAITAARRMCELARDLFTDLHLGVDNIGNYLHRNWELKKQLSGNISSPDIDLLYEKALDAGAEGGKLCGAGGGGFFLFYAPPEKHSDIVEVTGLRPVDFDFEEEGSKVIYAER